MPISPIRIGICTGMITGVSTRISTGNAGNAGMSHE
jgi:hypothetical protein